MTSIDIDVVTITAKIDDALFVTLSNVSQQKYGAINHIVIYHQASDIELQRLQAYNHCHNLSFYPQAGSGIATAFNEGIQHSQGRLILFLNSGDTLITDDVIERVIKSYTQHQWLWATGETVSLSRHKRLQRHCKQPQVWRETLFWYGNPVCHQSTFYSRQLIEKIGLYREDLKMGMDYEYNIRANLIAHPTLLHFPIAYYDTTGVSSIRVFQQFTNHRRIRDHYFRLSWFKRLKADVYCLLKSCYRLAMIPAKLLL
ncbi:glycosyltransferase [Pleurocapsa sp. CCALA 161]|uniref:glycosyltransferase n=1 Tax=Pleurocapsa sp. CCALA 161 TaxID=2107688 RepID=UPI000D0825C6|nr:glycosyltransferase [Pleurocapsa sp. CCALA 161]PSB09277.1 glycosyltransferase [Pleurocapsa sp. CCALA 161]